ncbi:MAG: PAS domain S-box protein [Pseudomonadota bacterium]
MEDTSHKSGPAPPSLKPPRDLRLRAEELFLKKAAQFPMDLETLPPDQIRSLLHELQVHQIELEMQNEELRQSQAELDAARMRYFDLYDLAPVGYCTLSETGVITEANLTAATLLGVHRTALIGQPFTRFIFAEDQDIYYRQYKQLVDTRGPTTCELRMVDSAGTPFWAQLTATATKDERGTPVCRITLSDNPERKVLETYKEISREVLAILNEPGDLQQSIQHILTVLKVKTGVDAVGIRLQDGEDFPYFAQDGFSEDFLQTENTLLRRTADGVMCRDKDGNVRLECTCGLVISGRTDPTNALFTPAGSCYLNDSSQLLDIPSGDDIRFHPRNICHHQGYASLAFVPIRGKDRIVGLIQLNDRRKGRFAPDTIELLEGIATHLGAVLIQKQDEEKLRKSESHLRTLLQTIPDLIWLKDKNGVYLSCNTKFERFFGTKEADIIGKTDYDFVDPELADFFIEHDRKAMAAGEPTSNEEWITYADDGHRVLLETIKTPMYNGGGILIGVLSIGRDITARKRAEDALQESETTVRKKLQAILMPEGDIGTLELADILDSPALQTMMEDFYRLTKIGIGILDMHGKVLVDVGWQDICTKFHRTHPVTLKNCIESDTELTRAIPVETRKAYHCKNNLWDIMTPLEIGGRRLGNVCLGQFFYDDESPDYAQFRAQARQYGFNEADYLAAIDRIPRWSRETVDATMAFYSSLSKMIASLSYNTVKLARTVSQKDAALRHLDENRAFLDSLLETIPIPVFYKDMQGRYLGVNQACEDLFGMSKEECEGKGVFDIHPPELARIYHAKDLELFEKHCPLVHESKILDAHGNLRDVVIHKAHITDAGGSITGLVGAIMDITERKKSETALALSEQRLQLTLQTSQIGIWDWNIESDTWYASPIYYTMLGYEPVAGPADRSAWQERIHPDDRNAVTEKIANVLQGSTKIYQYEARMRHSDGSYKWISVIGHAVKWDKENKPSRLIGVRIDVTERKLAEEENKNLQAQLQQAQKMEAVGLLAGGVAHDFNNMLGVILGHTEMAMEETDPAQPIFADLTEIRKAAERSADITRQLLAFARKQTVTPKVIDLNETIEGMLKMLRRLIGENINLAWLPGIGLWPIRMDPSQIDQILANLCVNARAAIAGVGKITIETENNPISESYCDVHPGFVVGEYVRISVSDNGCGMERKTMNHIFEPFFTTKGVGEGTGLGLATVYGAIKQNGGFINAYSEPGQGTTFKIFLPRYVGATGQLKKKDPEKSIIGGHETILLVEDEPTVKKMTAMMLENLGYTVKSADTPSEAIGIFEEFSEKIDLLFTDIIMPEMNGWDLAERLLAKQSKIKCLFMSGYTANVISSQGMLEGKMHFIQKPFSREALAGKIREALVETG